MGFLGTVGQGAKKLKSYAQAYAQNREDRERRRAEKEIERGKLYSQQATAAEARARYETARLKASQAASQANQARFNSILGGGNSGSMMGGFGGQAPRPKLARRRRMVRRAVAPQGPQYVIVQSPQAPGAPRQMRRRSRTRALPRQDPYANLFRI